MHVIPQATKSHTLKSSRVHVRYLQLNKSFHAAWMSIQR